MSFFPLLLAVASLASLQKMFPYLENSLSDSTKLAGVATG